MNKQTITQQSHIIMTPIERQMGRLMRAPDHPAPGNEGTGDNNQAGVGGNNSESTTGGGGEDNSGQSFDAEAFWNGPAPENNDASGNGESAINGTQGSGTQGQGGNQDGDNVGDALARQLSTLNFGESVFDPKVVEQINEGNFDGFNERMNSVLQGAVRNSLLMNVQVIREYGVRLKQQILDEVQGTLIGRDDQSQLIKDFPAAANPKIAPAIQRIFDQALKNTNGNRVEAVKQTKQMMSLMASETASDLNLDVAPRGQGDSRPSTASNIDWLQELAGR